MEQANMLAVGGGEGFELFANSGRPIAYNERTGEVQIRNPRGYVVNSLLRKDEWEELDRQVIQSALYPLRAVGDLRSRGLVQRLGGLGVLTSEWNVVSEMTAANVNMTGQSAGDGDRQDYNLAGVPIPVIYKEFSIGTRQLDAARRMNTQIDLTHAAAAARVVAEKMESMLIDGGGFTFNGNAIYGYTNHASRNTDTATNYGGGDWGTITNVVPTVAGMISAAQGDNMYGPYVIYAYTTQFNQAALNYFTDGSGQTAADRVRALDGVEGFYNLPTLAAGEVVLVQMTREVVDWAEIPEMAPVRVIEWASPDGMSNQFKVMAVAAPRIKADYAGRSGIVHATSA